MIDPRREERIAELLVAQLPHRAIASRLGVSRTLVTEIAAGRRPADLARRARKSPEANGGPVGPAMSCPGCGGLVYLPCRVCTVRRRIKAKSVPPRRPDRPLPPLTIALRDEDAATYEQLHAQKVFEFSTPQSALESDQGGEEYAECEPTDQELWEVDDADPV